MNKQATKPVSRYARKQAEGGSKYWDKTRHLIEAENRDYAIRKARTGRDS